MNTIDPGGRSVSERPVTYIRFDGWLAHVENAFNLFAAGSILALMLLAVLQVIGRLVFNTPVPGFIDITEQAMAIFAFAGIAYCQRVGGHIRMEIVLGKLSGRTLYICEMLGVILIALTVALLIWGSWYHFDRSWTIGDSTMDIRLPTWPSKLMVPVALSLLFLRLCMQIYGYARLVADPTREAFCVPMIEGVEEHAKHEIEEVFGDDVEEGGAR
ncbi:TRAP transporter small permease subunit [Roseibium aggregatum]|jgi:TRAP-type C4-dicarboxylate transport system permease small subunit|uniref:TRAP transporter small permease protein n=1 Tax=Roseibium aggregatum (strain ATCC 25650 / DSM 13394 / JCM 20685 / NBRC 16684 / NCIMB 2208 / IAM 12614 / B1) TaxID=384765 RepID=A0NUX2_ROSAI|nr:TRAP transporter small permease [Roseibium aggregatum]EAV43239.1 TRAP dicarboxylate transporter, DctQ subunit [Stappia aggregata IAM 12614] [Roseibium aggregatum IAM 12614]